VPQKSNRNSGHLAPTADRPSERPHAVTVLQLDTAGHATRNATVDLLTQQVTNAKPGWNLYVATDSGEIWRVIPLSESDWAYQISRDQ
jgi:hypothetical protein